GRRDADALQDPRAVAHESRGAAVVAVGGERLTVVGAARWGGGSLDRAATPCGRDRKRGQERVDEADGAGRSRGFGGGASLHGSLVPGSARNGSPVPGDREPSRTSVHLRWAHTLSPSPPPPPRRPALDRRRAPSCCSPWPWRPRWLTAATASGRVGCRTSGAAPWRRGRSPSGHAWGAGSRRSWRVKVSAC